MTIVNVLEAKTNLSRLIAEVEAGGEVIIARNNKPVVRLVAATPAGVAEPAAAWGVPPSQAAEGWQTPAGTPRRVRGLPPEGPRPKRIAGRLKGLIEWDDRFNDPLPDDELRLWNGEGD